MEKGLKNWLILSRKAKGGSFLDQRYSRTLGISRVGVFIVILTSAPVETAFRYLILSNVLRLDN